MTIISPSSNTLMRQKFLAHVSSQTTPTFYATCGIPGAGKSHFVDMKLSNGDFPSDAYILNPDRVMIALPEYIHDCDIIGAQKAYEKWELPTRELAYTMADEAHAMHANIIKDMGCANPLSLDLVKRLKSSGYTINMFYIYCDVAEAFKRINQRDFQISQEEVKHRLDLLKKLLPEYRSIADDFITLDNTNIQTPYKITE